MSRTIVGVISDTHGLVRQEALDALRGCSHILHAGDIGKPEVIESLSKLAPVTAIRGNNDKGAWASGLPTTEVAEVESTFLYILHDLAELDLDPAAAGFAAVKSISVATADCGTGISLTRGSPPAPGGPITPNPWRLISALISLSRFARRSPARK